MKKILLAVMLLSILLAGCTQTYSPYTSLANTIPEETTPSIVYDTPSESDIEKTVSEPETLKTSEAATAIMEQEPTPTQTLTKTPVFDEERVKILELMNKYNYIEGYQLSDEYWEKMAERIDKYGKAHRILPLEFHGDIYDMYDNYAMTEESFLKQITYLMENDYHFLTVHELQGFVSGWLDLPLRSIILTTDPGYLVWESNERMISNFSKLESIYGYKPHMITFIVTQGMSEEENYLCKDNTCWLSYIKGVEAGYFSLGTHTHWHNHHDEVTEQDALTDIKMSQEIIFENTGIKVYSISWPYEICSPYTDMLENTLGITLGFGGLTRPESNYVHKSDDQYLCLPRMFPENPNGLSGRPEGMTLEEMLEVVTGEWEENIK